jgi:hypothetical protein
MAWLWAVADLFLFVGIRFMVSKLAFIHALIMIQPKRT